MLEKLIEGNLYRTNSDLYFYKYESSQLDNSFYFHKGTNFIFIKENKPINGNFDNLKRFLVLHRTQLLYLHLSEDDVSRSIDLC